MVSALKICILRHNGDSGVVSQYQDVNKHRLQQPTMFNNKLIDHPECHEMKIILYELKEIVIFILASKRSFKIANNEI